MLNLGQQECFGIPRHQSPPRASITLAKRAAIGLATGAVLNLPGIPENVTGNTPTFNVYPFGGAYGVQVNEPGLYSLSFYIVDSGNSLFSLAKNPTGTSFVGYGAPGTLAVASANTIANWSVTDIASPGDFYVILASGITSPADVSFKVTKIG